MAISDLIVSVGSGNSLIAQRVLLLEVELPDAVAAVELLLSDGTQPVRLKLAAPSAAAEAQNTKFLLEKGLLLFHFSFFIVRTLHKTNVYSYY